MKIDRVRRRMFLQGAAGSALALPFLASLGGPDALAEVPPAGTIRRLIVVFIPYGTIQELWFPDATVMAAATPIAGGRGVELPTSAIAGDISPVFERAQLGALMDKMLLLDGIDGIWASSHNKTLALTGFTYQSNQLHLLPGPSIDQLVAERASLYAGEPAFRSLHLQTGHTGNSDGTSLSFTTNGAVAVPIPAYEDPRAFWDATFAYVSDGDPEDAVRFEAQRHRRASILDGVIEDHTRLQNHANLSSVDRERVDAYLTYLREYEERVASSELISCSAPDRYAGYDGGDGAVAMAQAADQVTNIIYTVRCDLSRVITWDVEAGSSAYPGITKSHHTVSHNKEGDYAPGSATNEASLGIDRFHMKLLDDLVQGLDVEEDPGSGRTYLDNSLVLVCSNMGSLRNHKGARMPAILLGGRDHFKSGRIVDLRSPHPIVHSGETPRTSRVGVSYNSLLVTVCQAMGLLPEDYELGQPGIGDYSPGQYYYGDFPGGLDAFDAYAHGDRRTPITELLV